MNDQQPPAGAGKPQPVTWEQRQRWVVSLIPVLRRLTRQLESGTLTTPARREAEEADRLMLGIDPLKAVRAAGVTQHEIIAARTQDRVNLTAPFNALDRLTENERQLGHLCEHGRDVLKKLRDGADVTEAAQRLDALAGNLEALVKAGTTQTRTGANTARQTKAKRSTERGDGQAKLIAALTKHHKYADDGCLNLDPVNSNELARLAGVAQSTASDFFKKKFGGHAKYKRICGNAPGLTASLKMLNGEFAPLDLYGAKPPGEEPPGRDGQDE